MKIRQATVSDTRGISIVHVKTWQATYKNILPQKMLQNLTYSNREAV